MCARVVPDATVGWHTPEGRTRSNGMKTKLFVVSSAALLALGMTSAQAGPCATEIEGLSKTMASQDAGSGPTSGAAGTHATASQAGQHPPTTAMSGATQGSAASP